MTRKKVASKSLPLNRERVLQAALELADTEGIEALSMRKIADVLGVKAMSLYNHVTNKDDILDGVVDIIIGEIGAPELKTDWQSAMRQRAMSAHDVLLQHPWATMPIVSRINVGPCMLNYIDATLGCLHKAGFTLELADHAWNTMDSHIYGYTLQELNFPIAQEDYASTAADYLAMIPEEKYPSLNRLTQHVINGDYDGLHSFEFGLDLILEGLEKLRNI